MEGPSGRTATEVIHLAVPVDEVPIFVHRGRLARSGVARCCASVVAAALLVPVRRVLFRLFVVDPRAYP